MNDRRRLVIRRRSFSRVVWSLLLLGLAAGCESRKPKQEPALRPFSEEAQLLLAAKETPEGCLQLDIETNLPKGTLVNVRVYSSSGSSGSPLDFASFRTRLQMKIQGPTQQEPQAFCRGTKNALGVADAVDVRVVAGVGPPFVYYANEKERAEQFSRLGEKAEKLVGNRVVHFGSQRGISSNTIQLVVGL